MNVFRKLPVRRQMYLIAALTLIIFVMVLWFSYNRSASLLTDNNEAYTNDIFSQMEQTIMSNYDVIKWLTYNIAYNKSVQDYLLNEDMLQKIDDYPTIKNLLLNLTTVKPGILDFIIMEKNGQTFSLQKSDIADYGNFMPAKADSYFSEMRPCVSSGGMERFCFAVGTNIFSSNINKQYSSEVGRIIILVDSSTLTGGYDLKSLQPGTSVYLLDRANTIFMSNDRTMIGQKLAIPELANKSGIVRLDGELTHIQMDELPMIGGKIVRMIPDAIFFKDIRKLRKETLLVFAMGVALLAVPFLLIVSNMIGPLRKLYREMKISGSEDFHKSIELYGSVEAVGIGNRYNQLLSGIDDLTRQLMASHERLLKSEIERRRSELNFLKSQINPHFLYNTLDSIRGIALERGVPEINEMTRALSRIFQYSIKGRDIVPLKDELQIMEAYMKIQMIRFSNRFAYTCDISEEMLVCSIPKMVLQPIVENAVYHGLEPRYQKGMLRLSAYADPERKQDVIITVQDDGVGMDEETLARCQALLRRDGREETDDRSEQSRNIGMANAHYRLQYLYGREYGLQIASKEQEGTVVTLRLPRIIPGGRTDVQSDDH